MPEAEGVAIGRLRWPVYIATRAQLAQVDDTGIDELLCDMQLVKADIQPVGALTFWGQAGEQIDGPVAEIDGGADHLGRVARRRLPHAEAELRHAAAVVQRDLRLHLRVHTLCLPC